MSQSISKKCFPPASKCHNCERKSRGIITDVKDREDLKRCSGCHLMTYCDKDCQKEHWNAVHKHHCKFLSGSKIVPNSKHNFDLCKFCTDGEKASHHEITDINSPKTVCLVDTVLIGMNTFLGAQFEFHKEGKTCGECTVNFGCRLPFSLGEVSGEYVGGGLEEMVAHSIRLANALYVKNRSDIVKKMLYALVEYRSDLWTIVLILGKVAVGGIKLSLCLDLLGDLEKCLGSNNPWQKALDFSYATIAHLYELQRAWNVIDLKNLDDPRFQTMKLMYQYDQSQLNEILLISQNKLWGKFKMWPTLNGDRLVLQLPDGIQCNSCGAELKGEFTRNSAQIGTVPVLLSTSVSRQGLVAFCPQEENPCYGIYVSKNPKISAMKNETQMKEYEDEQKMFLAKSRLCDVCLKNSFSSHRCSECLAAQYCSTKCQRKDLDFHKSVCAAWANDKYRRMMSSSQQKKVYKSLLYKKD